MIGIVDYGMGNVGSIVNMLKKVGSKGQTFTSPEEISQYEKVILPGVGSFDHAMERLNQSGLTEALKEHAGSGKAFMGICLGMQLLADGSEEGKKEGLGLIRGEVLKFQLEDLAIPHMGWNTVQFDSDEPLFANFEQFEESRFYFVHSYYYAPQDKNNVLTTTEYGHSFASGVKKDRVIGLQFHPEKSHLFGMELFKNFVNL